MIVCEGVNGAGKSTVLKNIIEHLRLKGCDIVITREPGGTPIGEKIREIILCKDTPEMFDITELMLFAAARAQHIREKIVPAIKAGKIVISDRFDASTKSFQHYGRGLSLDLINSLNKIALDGFKPDITIILDLDPVVGLERVKSRGDGLDRMERQELAFLQKARNGYLVQAKNAPEQFKVIDASRSLDRVITDVINIVDAIIADRGAIF